MELVAEVEAAERVCACNWRRQQWVSECGACAEGDAAETGTEAWADAKQSRRAGLRGSGASCPYPPRLMTTPASAPVDWPSSIAICPLISTQGSPGGRRPGS